MHIKINSDAEILPNANQRKSIGRIVLDVNRNQSIIDCDTLQAQQNAIRPRVIREVIVA